MEVNSRTFVFIKFYCYSAPPSKVEMDGNEVLSRKEKFEGGQASP